MGTYSTSISRASTISKMARIRILRQNCLAVGLQRQNVLAPALASVPQKSIHTSVSLNQKKEKKADGETINTSVSAADPVLIEIESATDRQQDILKEIDSHQNTKEILVAEETAHKSTQDKLANEIARHITTKDKLIKTEANLTNTNGTLDKEKFNHHDTNEKLAKV